ncbi:hypothetical protein ACOSQ2_019043 [Xanthoceras sorbifolium]
MYWFWYSNASGGKFGSLGSHSGKPVAGVLGGQIGGGSRFVILDEVSEEAVVISAENSGERFKSAK